MSEFKIELKEYQGPFSKILDLVKKNKLKINDISLTNITGEYLSFIKNNEFNLKEASNFIVVASTLMLIKSKTLLPNFLLSEEEEIDIEELKQRLKFLNIIKKQWSFLSNNFGKNIARKKIFKMKKEIKFRPHHNINQTSILESINLLVKKTKLPEPKERKVVEKTISLKEVMDKINKRINKYIKIKFSDILFDSSKKNVAVSFLAILELFKNNQINLEQKDKFSEIIINGFNYEQK